MKVIKRNATRTGWLLYRHPKEVIEIATIDTLSKGLDIIEARATEGFTCLGYVRYQGIASDKHDVTPPLEAQPIAAFGVFSHGSPYSFSPAQEDGFLGEGRYNSYEDYATQFAHVKSALAAGEAYQINLTHELSGDFWGAPQAIFSKLVEAQPTPHAMYLEHNDLIVISMSPETYLTRRGDELQMKPMKGTRARGVTAAQDESLRLDLANSMKDQAENLMIVDMVRNDLGRISSPGSVSTEALFEISPYPTVWQMTSTVTSKTDASLSDIFEATFPCASITGAPKIAAMNVIGALERRDRGVYTGALGQIGPGTNIDLGVAIRTLEIDCQRQRWRYGVGSGIVWDSQVEDEWAETLDKAKLLQAAQDFQLIETCRFTPPAGVERLSLHVERLSRSAAALGFKLDIDALQTELGLVQSDHPSRIRVTLSRHGNLNIAIAPLPPATESIRLSLAKAPINSRHATKRLIADATKKPNPLSRAQMTSFCSTSKAN
ncbi:MAG: hypothetical protein EBY55_05035 [Gammaproteobacteria bacterium]|nr:hypothetical protein [Gammaproteobacteria bacterium]